MTDGSVNYTLAISDLNLNELNDEIFNETLTIWIQFLSAEVEKLHEMFPTRRDTTFCDKVMQTFFRF